MLMESMQSGKIQVGVIHHIKGSRFGHQLIMATIIPAPLDEVFVFFSRAENLEKITPPWLNFRFVSPLPEKMESGALIEYALQVRLLPLRWVTEIGLWEPPYRFVDRQLKGPYREWIHEHRFEETDKGTLMTDTVRYRLPLGVLGKVAHRLFVRRDVEEIFRYRQKIIKEIFFADG
jgi:ligand-binding SRPBCC domain-containing protein